MTEGMLVNVERLDAHAADYHGLKMAVEVPSDLALSDLVATVLEPFLMKAPRATRVCRGRLSGQWRDVADVVTFGPSEQLGAWLLVEDGPLHAFVEPSQTAFELACHPRDERGSDRGERAVTVARTKVGGASESLSDLLPTKAGERGSPRAWRQPRRRLTAHA